MVLQKLDEGGRGQLSAGLTSRLSPAKRRGLPLIIESFSQAAAQMLERRVHVIGVVSILLSRKQHVKDMVNIVVPLGIVEPRTTLRVARQVAGSVVVILKHQVDLTLPGNR